MENKNKIRNKKWKINNVSKKHTLTALLEDFKSFSIKEAKLRKTAFKSLINFKKWYLTRLALDELTQKVNVIYTSYKKEKNLSDEQKDFLEERNRILRDLRPIKEDKNLPFINEMMIENKSKVRKFLQNKDLSKYKNKIQLDFYRGEEHYLDKKGKVISYWMGDIGPYIEIYNSLYSDRTTDDVYDSNGKKIEKGSWNDAFTSSDPKIRETSWLAYSLVWRTHRNTLSDILYYVARKMQKGAKLHGYKNEIEWKAFAFYGITLNEYEFILNQVCKFAKEYKKWDTAYSNIIKAAYELESFEPWDMWLTIKDTYEKVDEKQTEAMVLESLKPLGEDYCNKVKDIFSKNIINWTKTQKSPNGYCISGAAGLDESPINFNWNGTTTAVFTLSHELGHNLKLHYSKLNNDVVTGEVKIEEELPSIVNEFLTLFYLIDKYKKEKNNTFLFGAYYELFRYFFHCTSEGICDAQFRDAFVTWFNKDGSITPETIEKIYINVKGICYGMSKQEQKKELNEWPYNNQKCFAYSSYMFLEDESDTNVIGYALGCIVGLIVANKIYHGDKQMLKRYLNFLKTTRTVDAFNGFKTLGINIQKPEIYTQSKHLIDQYLNDFIETIKVSKE